MVTIETPDPGPPQTSSSPKISPRQLTTRFVGLLALFVSAAGSLFLAEMAVRHFYGDEIDTAALEKVEATIEEMGGVAQPAQNSELLFELKRGLDRPWMQTVVRTSDIYPGRIATFAPPLPQPAVRIALLGDSTPFGYGMPAEVAYPELLRSKLELTFGKTIELRNYSVPGYNSTQQRVIMESEILPWKPDLLILHYDHNDADPVLLHDRTGPDEDVYSPYTRLPPQYGDNILNSSLIKFTLRRLRVIRRKASYRATATRDKNLRKYEGGYRCAGPFYEGHLEEIRRMGRGAAQLEIPALALIYDSKITHFENHEEDSHYTALHSPIAHILQEAGFRVLDLYPRLQDLMRDKGWNDLAAIWRQVPRGTDKDHPNESGHFFIANQLFLFLRADPTLKQILESAKEPAQPEAFRQRLAATANYQAALLLAARDKHAEAESLLREARGYNPNDVGLCQNLARLLIIQEKNKEAIEQLTQLVALKPELDVEHFLLAELLAKERNFTGAIAHFLAVIDLPTPSDINALATEKLAGVFLEFAREQASKDRGNALDSAGKALNLYRYLGKEAKTVEAEGLYNSLQSGKALKPSESAQ